MTLCQQHKLKLLKSSSTFCRKIKFVCESETKLCFVILISPRLSKVKRKKLMLEEIISAATKKLNSYVKDD